MGKIFEKAVAALKKLPAEERERISAELLERLDDRSQWDNLVNSHKSYAWLKKNADRAIREYDRIAKNFLAAPSTFHLIISCAKVIIGKAWKNSPQKCAR